MEYVILEEVSKAGMARAVIAKLESGWTCQGGIALSHIDGRDYYYQAMTRGNYEAFAEREARQMEYTRRNREDIA